MEKDNNAIQESEKIQKLLNNLELVYWKHYSSDNKLNEERRQHLEDLKIRIFKNGLDQTIKEISFAGL